MQTAGSGKSLLMHTHIKESLSLFSFGIYLMRDQDNLIDFPNKHHREEVAFWDFNLLFIYNWKAICACSDNTYYNPFGTIQK